MANASPQELFDVAFHKDTMRTPRSLEYKTGVLALLRQQIEGTKLQCPWLAGTAGYDAFYSGVEEGWHILQQHNISIRRSGRHQNDP